MLNANKLLFYLKNSFRDKSKILQIITFIVFCFAVIMLILYFYNFRKYGLSDDINYWAGFGSYFASITGLLAFVGVLYSSSLSEKRALKAEIEFKKKEDREFFFKSIDLLQHNLNEVKDGKNINNVNVLTGIDPFSDEVLRLSDLTFIYFINDFFLQIDGVKFRKFINEIGTTDIERSFIEFLLKINNEANSIYKISHIRTKDQLDFEIIKTNLLNNHKLFYTQLINYPDSQPWIDMIYNRLEANFTSENIFQILIKTNHYYFHKSSEQVKAFCYTFHYIIDYLYTSNLDKEKCLKILFSQINQNLLIILYVYLFRYNKEANFVKLFKEYDVFTTYQITHLFILNSLVNLKEEDIKKQIVNYSIN